jgi:hypothetical protein
MKTLQNTNRKKPSSGNYPDEICHEITTLTDNTVVIVCLPETAWYEFIVYNKLGNVLCFSDEGYGNSAIALYHGLDTCFKNYEI